MKSLLLDVDGVCADFIGGLERKLGRPFDARARKNWDILVSLDKETKDKVLNILSSVYFWRELPVVEGAQEGVRNFEDLGYEIVWVTSPWDSCPSWYWARKEWLDNHFQMTKRKHDYIPTSAKERVMGNVFIDDKPSNITKWLKAQPPFRENKAYLFDTPYNQDAQLPRFKWGDIL